jgi:hypothetical protein
MRRLVERRNLARAAALGAALLSATLPPVSTGAQAPLIGAQPGAAGPEAGVSARTEHRRVIVQPLPSRETVERDADQAVDAIARRERLSREAQESAARAVRRPDLDRDVVGGIQTRNLNRLLR